ncbi:hypothetical protein C8J57DRAFT_1255813 [Mycena rebaudengoi]|nr:hypothetical protein C8J57DRAFT_1255813 [Mycena rebaudengoi]
MSFFVRDDYSSLGDYFKVVSQKDEKSSNFLKHHEWGVGLMFISLEHVTRGAFLCPIFGAAHELFYVIDYIDGDMFLHQFKNPIYLFYEAVNKNAMGTTGKPGDKHYKCRDGNRKIITVTKAMRYNVSGA